MHGSENTEGILDGPGASYRQGKVSTVASTSAWICIENDVAVGCQYLHFMKKAIAVLAIRSTMNFYNHRVLLCRIEIVGFENPAVDWPTINACIRHVLGCRQGDIINERVIEAGNAPQFSW